MEYKKDLPWNDVVYIFKDTDEFSESDLENIFHILPNYRLEKVKKYRRSIDRKNCAIAYLLLIISLSRELDIEGEAAMVYGSYGKPYLKDYPDIYFNLSHCSRGVVCAISKSDIGVDIETIDSSKAFLSSDVFSPKELEYIISLGEEDVFFRLWVLKEAAVKRTGTGLVYGADFIEFLSPKDGTFCKDGFLYHLKKIDDMYLAVCSEYPVRYQIVTRKELLNI